MHNTSPIYPVLAILRLAIDNFIPSTQVRLLTGGLALSPAKESQEADPASLAITSIPPFAMFCSLS
jgi:hypothetical protein